VYQIEVKRYLVEHLFLSSEGWEVVVDIDAMERGISGQQPPGKREIAERCETYLREHGVRIGAHPVYKRADVVATHPAKGTFVIEVDGQSSRQSEQKMYSALGQLLLAMTRFEDNLVYGIAAPDLPEWELTFHKIPSQVCSRLSLRRLLVSEEGIRSLEPRDDH
jgi:hypothetical protein